MDVSAIRDQYQAMVRDYAESVKDIHDQYIRAGFTRDEALKLLFWHLDEVEGGVHDAST